MTDTVINGENEKEHKEYKENTRGREEKGNDEGGVTELYELVTVV